MQLQAGQHTVLQRGSLQSPASAIRERGGKLVQRGPPSLPGHWSCLVVMPHLLMSHITTWGCQ